MQMSDPTETPLSLAPLVDDSSADVTTQLAAADRTVDDLDAFTPEAADATGEIEALDILEVVEVLRTSRIPVAPVSQPVSVAPHAPPCSRANEVLETSRLPAVMIAPRPSVPSMQVTAMAPSGQHPSSIAPLALDVSPPPPRGSYASDPSYGSATHAAWRTPMPPDLRESTLQIARAAGIPSRASRIVVFTASVGGMCLVAGILGVMLGYSHAPAKSAQPMSLAAPGPVAPGGGVAPRVAVVTSAHEEITEGPILVPAKDAASIAADPLDELAVKPAPMATPVAVAVAVAVAPVAPVAPVARATPPAARSSAASSPSSSSASTSSTGVLRLPASVSGVLIDGVPHKAGGGGLVVSCGRHTVKAPGHPSRLVIVPCGGSAAL